MDPRTMSLIPPETRRRNLVTFVVLVVFAFGLCAFVLWSMRIHARRQQEEEAAHANPATSLWLQSGLSSAA